MPNDISKWTTKRIRNYLRELKMGFGGVGMSELLLIRKLENLLQERKNNEQRIYY